MKKAEKTTINLGSVPLDVYQMPDGSYKLYWESITAVVGQSNDDLLIFLRGESPQALPYKNQNVLQSPMIEVEEYGGRIRPVLIKLATSYWLYHAIKGNQIAQAIIQASLAESIERRADAAFQVKRTGEEYNQKFGERLEEILADNRKEIQDRRLPGDNLYLPPGIS